MYSPDGIEQATGLGHFLCSMWNNTTEKHGEMGDPQKKKEPTLLLDRLLCDYSVIESMYEPDQVLQNSIRSILCLVLEDDRSSIMIFAYIGAPSFGTGSQALEGSRLAFPVNQSLRKDVPTAGFQS